MKPYHSHRVLSTSVIDGVDAVQCSTVSTVSTVVLQYSI